MERWGIAILGTEPDFMQIIKSTRALGIFNAFDKASDAKRMKDMSPDEWKTITDTLRVVEGWKDA